jgi:hypothetical protein
MDGRRRRLVLGGVSQVSDGSELDIHEGFSRTKRSCYSVVPEYCMFHPVCVDFLTIEKKTVSTYLWSNLLCSREYAMPRHRRE